MHHLFMLVFVGAASATAVMQTGQHNAFMALKGVMERQIHVCKPVSPPATCERSCGPGYITCISFPTCYNPSAGETCCSDGTSCPAGYYCTDASCCPNGTPLAECGATVSLSIVPPPASSPSTPLSHSTHSTAPTPSDTSAPEASYTTTSKVPTIGTPTATTSYTLPTGTQKPPSNGTATTTKPSAQATAGAGRLGTNILAAFGGLGVLIAVL